jgi:hypothetical protein
LKAVLKHSHRSKNEAIHAYKSSSSFSSSKFGVKAIINTIFSIPNQPLLLLIISVGLLVKPCWSLFNHSKEPVMDICPSLSLQFNGSSKEEKLRILFLIQHKI